jgi:uncharacterized protein (TIGR02996 family)
MNARQTFIRNIYANPDDIALKLVFADWLEERDDPRAEFIRLQYELEKVPLSMKDEERLKFASQTLLQKHEGIWLEEDVSPISPKQTMINNIEPIFRYGFVHGWSFPANYNIDPNVYLTSGINTIELRCFQSDSGENLGRQPRLSQISSLWIDNIFCQSSDAVSTNFFASKYLNNVTELRMRWCLNFNCPPKPFLENLCHQLKRIDFRYSDLRTTLREFFPDQKNRPLEFPQLELLDLRGSIDPHPLYGDQVYQPPLEVLAQVFLSEHPDFKSNNDAVLIKALAEKGILV